MNKIIKKTAYILLSVIVLQACKGGANSGSLKKYEDDHISFSYPQNWEVKRIDQSDINFYNVNVKNAEGNFAFTFDFRIENQGILWSKEAIEELESSFSVKEEEKITSEMIPCASGEQIYYYETNQDPESHNGFAKTLGFFAPANQPEADYMIVGGVQITDEMFEAVKNKEILNLAKSMIIKRK